jgi:Ca2+-binding EF-hand superfamily protein
LIKVLDPNQEGFISLDKLKSGLATLKVFLTDHEEHLIIRKFDPQHTGRISMEDFYRAL